MDCWRRFDRRVDVGISVRVVRIKISYAQMHCAAGCFGVARACSAELRHRRADVHNAVAMR